MYLIVLSSDQVIGNYLKAEKLRLRYRFIGNEISRRGRKRVKHFKFILKEFFNLKQK